MSVKATLARTAKFITDYNWGTNWSLYAQMFDIEGIADSTYRLYKSQQFDDIDYPERVINFFNAVLSQKGEQIALDFVKYVISQTIDLKKAEVVAKDPTLLESLNLLSADTIVPAHPDHGIKKYLDIQVLPDNFYYDLQNEINRAYAYKIYPAVRILSRKLLENLIIDVLRKQYTMAQIDLFYDTRHGRFQNFETLLRNFADKLVDFEALLSSKLDNTFTNKIDKFRQRGNSSAHSIELSIDPKELEQESTDLEHVIKVMVRLLNNQSG